MKNLTRILSILLAFALIVVVIMLFDIKNINEFESKVFLILWESFLPIIGIALCAVCLERNDTNYLVRIVPIYLTIPIVLSIINVTFSIGSGFTVDLYNFLSYTFVEIICLMLLLIIKPNNSITKYLIYISFMILAGTIIYSFIIHTSSNKTDFDSINSFYSILYENANNYQIYISLYIIQICLIPLIYITNYAFSDKIEIEANDIDYETVKEKAETLANAQMNSIYNLSQKSNEPDRSQSDKGLMNVNNQLGQNSNVGNTTTQAREVNVSGSTLDSLVPLSKGPVINNTVNEIQNQVVETNPPQEEKVEQTTPPNLDIQEQMRLNREQNNINQ